jgi:hypothetical protein
VTSRDDPPRLRRGAASLPRELALALESSPEEEAKPEDLEQVASAVRRELETSDRKSLMLHRFPKRRAPLGRTMAFVATFALGAGAGVLVSGGVFVATRQAFWAPKDSVKVVPSARARVATRSARPVPKNEAVAAAELEALPIASAEPDELRPRAAAPAPAASTEESVAPSPAEELALLNRAQSLLGQNPAMALMLASDHQRRFRPGTLVQEREVIAIDALLRLGQRPAAEARAARFRQQFPASVHLRRVDVLLGVGSSSPPDHN